MPPTRSSSAPRSLLTTFFSVLAVFVVLDVATLASTAHGGCAFPPSGVSDGDCDGLVDATDPCPTDTLNRCNGPVAACGAAPPGAQECVPGVDLRLDLGASAPQTDCNGDVWAWDVGGGGNCCSSPVLAPATIVDAFGCTDASTELMVGSEKFGATITRSYPVADGTYIVNLIFAETFAGACTAGWRTVDIDVEGVRHYGGPGVGDGFDQFSTSEQQNGAAEACGGVVVRSVLAAVADGSLDIVLTEDDPGFGDANASIKAIEVLHYIDGCIDDSECDDGDPCTTDICGPTHACHNDPPGIDADGDGICDLDDMCPDDGLDDIDGDGVCAGTGANLPASADGDNCPFTSNGNQLDTDGDGRGNACDRCPNATGSAEDACLGNGFWETRATCSVARGEAGTAIVDGKVYLIGGEQPAAGRDVEIYDVAGDGWSSGPRLPEPPTGGNIGRSHLQPAVVGKRIYLFGGFTTTTREPLDEVLVLDTEDIAEGWQPLAPMPALRGGAACASHGVRVYCAGGVGNSALDPPPSSAALDIYNTVTDRWHAAAPMPHARDSAYAHVIGKKLYLVSGRDTHVNNAVPFTDIYDIATDSWSAGAPPPVARGGYASAVVEGRILLISGELGPGNGGNADGVIATVHEYDPVRDGWRSLTDIPTPRHGFMAVVMDGGPGTMPIVHTISGGPTQGYASSVAHEVFSFSQCNVDADCDDGEACTDDVCDDNVCSYVPNSAPCDDGVYCNGADTCGDGTCTVHDGNPCSDGVGCTVDACDEDTSDCSFTPDDAACDDDAYCNGTEVCDPLLDCQGGTPVQCADALDCTVDSCDEAADDCVHAPSHAACDDGVLCNGAEVCDAAAGCGAGAPTSCDDGVDCTADHCDAGADTCVNTPSDTICDDGNECTTDHCDAGAGCTGADNVNACNDGLECTRGDVCAAGTCAGTPDCPGDEACDLDTGRCTAPSVCVAAADAGAVFAGAMTTGSTYAGGADQDVDADSLMPLQVHADSPANSAGGSGDQLTYTIDLPHDGVWNVWGRFYYPGVPGSNDANSFIVSVDGGQTYPFGNNKDFFQKWHWDGNGNVQAGAVAPLSLGFLAAGEHQLRVEKREVNPVAPRLDAICLSTDPAAPPADAGVSYALGVCDADADCDDRNPCTDDACDDGACAHSDSADACDDGITCNGADACADGSCSTHAGTPCDDGVDCTTDECREDTGACTNTAIDAACDDGVGCTADRCDVAAGGCDNAVDDESCDDGLFCNGTEFCSSSDDCGSRTELVCGHLDDTCIVGVCNEDDDSCAIAPANEGLPCEDGDACTIADFCEAGACVSLDHHALDAGTVRVARRSGVDDDRMIIRALLQLDLLPDLPSTTGVDLAIVDESDELVYDAAVPAEAFRSAHHGTVFSVKARRADLHGAENLTHLKIKLMPARGQARITAKVGDIEIPQIEDSSSIGMNLTFGKPDSGTCVSAPDMECNGAATVRCTSD